MRDNILSIYAGINSNPWKISFIFYWKVMRQFVTPIFILLYWYLPQDKYCGTKIHRIIHDTYILISRVIIYWSYKFKKYYICLGHIIGFIFQLLIKILPKP